MEVNFQTNDLTNRVEHLHFRAESFADQRILAILLSSIEAGDHSFSVTQNGEKLAEFSFGKCRELSD